MVKVWSGLCRFEQGRKEEVFLTFFFFHLILFLSLVILDQFSSPFLHPHIFFQLGFALRPIRSSCSPPKKKEENKIKKLFFWRQITVTEKKKEIENFHLHSSKFCNLSKQRRHNIFGRKKRKKRSRKNFYLPFSFFPLKSFIGEGLQVCLKDTIRQNGKCATLRP